MVKLSFMFLSIFAATSLVGCSQEPATPNEAMTETAKPEMPEDVDTEVSAALAELSPEDRALAKAQKYCAVESENLLGSMGAPVKVIIEGEPVFLCCAGCEDSALADPQKTLASLHELQAANKTKQ
jgi:hypothetical protein